MAKSLNLTPAVSLCTAATISLTKWVSHIVNTPESFPWISGYPFRLTKSGSDSTIDVPSILWSEHSMNDSEPDDGKPPIHLSPRNADGLLKIIAATVFLASLAYGLARLLQLLR